MTDTEDLIRAAIAKQVTRAPHAGPVIAALDEGPRRRRPRPRLVAAAAGVVAVAAVAVGIPLPVGDGPHQLPVQPATAKPVADGTFRYTATWLPDGYVESTRSYVDDGSYQSRVWTTPTGAGFIELHVVTPANAGWETSVQEMREAGGKVDYGAAGKDENPHQGALTWMPEPDVLLQLELVAVADIRATIERVAGSVRRDGKSTLSAGVRFGGSGLDGPTTVHVQGVSDSAAFATLHRADVSVSVSREEPEIPAGAMQVTINGRSAWHKDRTLWGHLADGRWMSVSCMEGTERLLDIANSVVVDPPQSYPWIGTR